MAGVPVSEKGVKVIVVAGSGSGVGKTALICHLLRVIPGLGVIKLSPREGGSPVVEWGTEGEDPGKDTGRFRQDGAALVARVVSPRSRLSVPLLEALSSMASCRAVIIEGSSALGVINPALVIMVVGPEAKSGREKKNKRILSQADLIIFNTSLGSCSRVKWCQEMIHQAGKEFWNINLRRPDREVLEKVTERINVSLSL